MFKTTAFEIWRKEQELPRLITLIKELDDHMGGGLPLGIITELCGAPGVGKTQLWYDIFYHISEVVNNKLSESLQLCLNVQFPENIGGLGGKAFYIDTNQDFSPYRLKELAINTEHRFQKAIHKLGAENESTLPSPFHSFCASNLLQNISHVYCSSYTDLFFAVHNFRNILKEDPKLKLIIIDSFSFCIRQLHDVNLRTRIIYEILNDLQLLALEYNIAIILTNELTTRFLDNEWLVAPALGDSYTHKINQRLILSYDVHKPYHVAMIDKSVLCPKIAVRFKIKSSGIRGITT